MNVQFLCCFFCALATFLFSLTVGAFVKRAAIAGVLGGVGYTIYSIAKQNTGEATSVFVATLVVCVAAEIFARVMKTPSTVFSIPAIVPLVPGVMLYKTMVLFDKGNTLDVLAGTVETLIVAGSMSLAVTIATLLAKYVFKRIK